MDTFFKLIETIPTPRDEFDVPRYNEIVKSFEVYQYDDFICHFAFFLYEFPLKETHQKIFNEKELGGKFGIAVRHLIKTAKRLGVDQNLIDYYFDLKDRKGLYKRCLQYSKEDIAKIKDEYTDEDEFELHKYYRTLIRFERNEIGERIYGHEFNRVTFKIIKSVLESK